MKSAFTRKVITVSIAVILVAFIILRLIRFDETVAVINRVKEILQPFIIGACLAYLMNFLYVKVLAFGKKHYKHINSDKAQRYIAIIITEVSVLGIITALLIITVPSVVESLRAVANTLPKTIDNLRGIIDDFIKDNRWLHSVIGSDADEVQAKIQNFLVNDLNYDSNYFSEKLLEIIGGTFTYTINILIAIIVNIMLLANKDMMKEQGKNLILATFGEHKSNIIFEELRIANKKFGSFLIGKLIDSAIIGVITFISCLILGINYSALIALIVGLTNIIPFIGPFIGGIPATVIVFSQSPKLSVYFIIFIVVLQQIDGNIIGPKCIGSSLDLNSFWVLLAILVFGKLFGIFGMIIGVPTFAVIYDIVGKIIHNKIEKQAIEKNIKEQQTYWITNKDVKVNYAVVELNKIDNVSHSDIIIEKNNSKENT